ncbi:dof zinc finger protein DOF5.4-like [Carya illinoinensis]|uniref:Dof zinc finger protein n=1 Tax=Carya illinoinensis TaxID=32201 RepID=A0A8T1NBR2_CARIL|nr:dof zinc finger protein DOF5.4-like [Carya illinoinensis]KAG6627261.1 hypothetical protein CIPAW_15G114200 [Carya illinoinensis]
MQEIHSIGGGGRLFGGVGGVGPDRRLRPHHQHHNQQQQNHHQALKCPRCDSLNTKFCYYNNYNQSQPRHFCKSCRRYWTKGGVLRNVPVGGGCRKAKRSKPKPASSDTSTPQPQRQRERKSNSNSSSESSSLTATNTNAATEAVSTEVPSLNSYSNLLNVPDSKLFISNPSFETGLLEQGSDCGIFSEIGSFTSLITASNEALPFGFNGVSETTPFRLNHQSHDSHQQQQWQQEQQQQCKAMMRGTVGKESEIQQEITGELVDQTVQFDLSSLQDRSGGGGFGSLDWQVSGDQDLFDLPNTVDQAYWSQSQWADQDHPSLFIP